MRSIAPRLWLLTFTACTSAADPGDSSTVDGFDGGADVRGDITVPDSTAADRSVDADARSGACASGFDGLALRRQDYGPTTSWDFAEVVSRCSFEQLIVFENGGDYERSVDDCIRRVSNDAVSSDCSRCFSEDAHCIATSCFDECTNPRSGPACTACRCGEGAALKDCSEQFAACAGRGSPYCES
ncbi:MAG: hypothetical protein AAGF12_22530 [Myxococcota bacterium]